VGFFKKLLGGVKDVAKAVSYVVAAPVNSITGHVYNPQYETDFGNAVGQTLENSVDNLHRLAKGFADRLTFGYASKAANIFRDADHKESLGHYLEGGKDYGFKFLNKLNQFSGALGGSFSGNNVQSGSGSGNGNVPEPDNYSGLIKIAAVLIAVLVLLGLLFKK
jgi:hypothetical protein